MASMAGTGLCGVHADQYSDGLYLLRPDTERQLAERKLIVIGYVLDSHPVLCRVFCQKRFVLNERWNILIQELVCSKCTGETKLHREWMMRNYAGTFAFVTFRIGLMFGGTHSPLPLLGIVINMILIEAKIQYDYGRCCCKGSKE